MGRAALLTQWVRRVRFGNSGRYWERRYAAGRTSGAGSYGPVARFKAEFLNDFVRTTHVNSVIELGCGDGHQLGLAEYPSYLGLDVSPTATRLCIERFRDDPTKSFLCYQPDATENHGALSADLALSLDVIFHLVEDTTFDRYMRLLFSCARRSVVVFSTNFDGDAEAAHVRHRRFSDWIERGMPDWSLMQKVENPLKGEASEADFFVFGRV